MTKDVNAETLNLRMQVASLRLVLNTLVKAAEPVANKDEALTSAINVATRVLAEPQR